jgi:hypothetical protein
MPSLAGHLCVVHHHMLHDGVVHVVTVASGGRPAAGDELVTCGAGRTGKAFQAVSDMRRILAEAL